MVCIRGISNIDGGFEIRSINKDKIFKYNIKVVDKADDSISIILMFMNEAKEIVLDWKIKLTKEWLDRKDVRNTENKSYRDSLDLRLEQMIKLIETENCSFYLPANEEEFFTKILYN